MHFFIYCFHYWFGWWLKKKKVATSCCLWPTVIKFGTCLESWIAIVWPNCSPDSRAENSFLSLSCIKRSLQLRVSWVAAWKLVRLSFWHGLCPPQSSLELPFFPPLNLTRRRRALTSGVVQRWEWCFHTLSICVMEELTLNVFLKLKPLVFHTPLKHKLL